MKDADSGRWWTLAFFVAALLGYLWRNDFPYFYHSDEESKAMQILHGYRNYWHPLLLINATDLLATVLQVGKDPQRITELGRVLSAVFAAIGVGAMVRLGFWHNGRWGGILTGVFLLTCPLLFEVAHYAKEDAGLFMGLALTLAAGTRFWQVPQRSGIVVLGVAIGLAISAKFPGLILLPVGLAVVLLKTRKWPPVCWFFLIVLATVLTINWQWTYEFPKVLAGFQREKSLLTGGHDGIKGSLPHAIYFDLLKNYLGRPLLALAVVGAGWRMIQLRRITLEGYLGGAVAFLLVVMSYSPKVSDRYLLPVLVMLLFLAAQAVVELSRLPRRSWLAWVAIVWGLWGLWVPVKRLDGTLADFRRDSRAELMQFVQTHFPGKNRIATSLWTRLPGDYRGWYFTKEKPLDFVADAGTLDELRARGFHFVAVADVEQMRFRAHDTSASSLQEDVFRKRRTFYEDLEKNADQVWHVPQGLVYTLHPGLSLYRLAD